MSNEELVLAYQRGEIEFDEIYNQMYKMMQKLKHKMLREGISKGVALLDSDDINSLFLEALYKATLSYNQDKKVNFSTYAYTLMRNIVLRERVILTYKKRHTQNTPLSLDFKYDLSEEEGDTFADFIASDDDKIYKDLDTFDFINEVCDRRGFRDKTKQLMLNYVTTDKTVTRIGKELGMTSPLANREFKKLINVMKMEVSNW